MMDRVLVSLVAFCQHLWERAGGLKAGGGWGVWGVKSVSMWPLLLQEFGIGCFSVIFRLDNQWQPFTPVL